MSLLSQSTVAAEIDSLKMELATSPENYELYYGLATLLKEQDTTKSLEYLRQGIGIAADKRSFYGIGRGKFLLGDLYADFGNPVKAEYQYRSADSVLSNLLKKDSSEQNIKLWIRNTFNLGVVRSYQGFNEDILYLEKITPLAEKIRFYDILAKANTNLAIGFYNQAQMQKAYAYFQIGGEQHLKAEDYDSFSTNKLIFASCLLQMDSVDVAKKQLDLVLPLLDNTSKPQRSQLYHTVLGEYHIKKEQFDEAFINLQMAESFIGASMVQSNKLPLYMTFIKAAKGSKRYESGLKYALKCMELAAIYDNKIIEAEIYKELAFFQYKLNQPRQAFASLSNYVAISDSLNIPELEKEINRLEEKYQSEKKEREILQLTNENKNVELDLVNKQAQNYFLLLVSLGLLIASGMAFLGYRNFKKSDQLKASEIHKLKYEQEAKLFNAMIEGQESERKRLAIDLHDGLAGRLSATKIKLQKLAQKADNEKTVKDFKAIAQTLDDSLTELRGIAMNLMPETLFKYGLQNAVEDYCSSIGLVKTDIKFILQFYDTEHQLPDATNLTIYRVIQELINNAVKHSSASEVFVQYVIEDEKIHITVEDNGTGFMQKKQRGEGGMGLSNLKTRVAYLNGELDFDSVPDEGTTVDIIIPI